jgi:hypothetical protein
MFVASELATDGSVIAKQLLMSPFKRGRSHCAFCSSVPYRVRTSMLPVSGALRRGHQHRRGEREGGGEVSLTCN